MDELSFAFQAFLDTHETVVRLDFKTEELIFIKHDHDTFELHKPYDVKKFVQQYLNSERIHKDDIPKFEIFLQLPLLKERCVENGKGILMAYRRIFKDEYIWKRIMLAIPQGFPEKESSVLLYRNTLPSIEADLEEAYEAFGKKIRKIIRYNLTTGRSRIINQRKDEESNRNRNRALQGNDVISIIEEQLVYPADLETYRYYTNHTMIHDHFLAGNREYSFYYRRKTGRGYQWVKLTIIPSIDYSEDNQLFLYIIEDVHHELLHLFDKQGMFQFSDTQLSSSKSFEVYHENLLDALSFLTERYQDFFMVDLDKDIYISYKLIPEFLSGNFSSIGKYSSIADYYQENFHQYKETEAILPFFDPKVLQQKLKDRASLEYSFRDQTGRFLKMICTKVESYHNIPSKIICCSLPVASSGLLKVKTFGNFEVYDAEGKPLHFRKKQSKALFAYLIDKHGFPVSTKDIVIDILEKDPSDLNAIKYVSTISRYLIQDLEKAGFQDIVLKEWNTIRVRVEQIDCDYYHLVDGDTRYWHQYHNEYMIEYSWAEETNADILNMSNR